MTLVKKDFYQYDWQDVRNGLALVRAAVSDEQAAIDPRVLIFAFSAILNDLFDEKDAEGIMFDAADLAAWIIEQEAQDTCHDEDDEGGMPDGKR